MKLFLRQRLHTGEFRPQIRLQPVKQKEMSIILVEGERSLM